MTSVFDTSVRNRREHTPWATISLIRFMKEMTFNGEGEHYQHATKLSVQYRSDVASRFWWTIEWTGADGQRHEQSAQDLELCLWRAAESEVRTQQQMNAEKRNV